MTYEATPPLPRPPEDRPPCNGAQDYPATMLVHWPTGPVACCAEHGRQLIGLGSFLGSHIVATHLTEPAECVSCLNEGPPSA